MIASLSSLSSTDSPLSESLKREGSRLCLVVEDDDPLRPLIRDLDAGDWAREVDVGVVS